MDAIGETVTVVGIPAGVKMHSGVFAADPRNAGLLAKEYLEGKARTTVSCEVMDIDEEAFRENRLSAQLYGYMKIPQSRGRTQGGKVSSPKSLHEVEGIGMAIADKMEADVLYIIGPGSTTVSIMEAIGIPYTLLGIDLVINKQLIAADVTEKRILESLGFQTKAKIVVTPIGGQAYLFGRGNQQISPEVIRQVGKENIVIVATRAKLATFSGSFLRVDTGDPELDRELSGYYRVQVDYREETVFRVGG
jgi:predicted polyphosphate/ATP-dependent NAD kinase